MICEIFHFRLFIRLHSDLLNDVVKVLDAPSWRDNDLLRLPIMLNRLAWL